MAVLPLPYSRRWGVWKGERGWVKRRGGRGEGEGGAGRRIPPLLFLSKEPTSVILRNAYIKPYGRPKWLNLIVKPQTFFS